MPKFIKEIVKGTEVNFRNDLPSLLVDSLNISTRSDKFILLRFLSQLPEGLFEQSKVFIFKDNLIKMIDAMSEHTGYYPTKPEKKTQMKSQKID